jgi:hypothetical protein
MRRVKPLGAAALLAAVFLFAAYNLVRVVTSGEIYARRMGWVSFADHPASFTFGLLTDLLILVAALVGLALAWRFRGASTRNHRGRNALRQDHPGRE